MKHTAELLPCEVCGKKAALGYHCNARFVECSDDGCGHQSPMFWTDEEAITAWNTRTDAQLRADRDALLEACLYIRPALAAIADSAVEAGFDKLADVFDEVMVKVNAAIDQAEKNPTLIARIRGEG